MSMQDIDKLLGLIAARIPAPFIPTLEPGQVTKLDPSSGAVWVTSVDGDARTPLGPCEGDLRGLTIGSRVLTARTRYGTWILAAHHDWTEPPT